MNIADGINPGAGRDAGIAALVNFGSQTRPF
jgi:hypothetical protein